MPFQTDTFVSPGLGPDQERSGFEKLLANKKL